MKKFYVTTAIPYVNGKPHLGHALEFVQADVVARYHRLQGYDVTLLSGSDENGLKIVRAAENEQIGTQELCDRNTLQFQEFARKFSVDIDIWRRGTDQRYHWPGVGELWKKGQQAGDIYRKTYRGLYCVGCEDFYLPKDLIDGKCPEHLKEPEIVEEENYFFRLSKYESQLKSLISSNELKIVPSERRNETLAWIESGLQDFSISRSVERAKGWGIPVPGDPSQVIYTWYDGLAIYMTGVGYGYDEKEWGRQWPADIHFIGKGINRFHTIYWPAMLLSAGLPTPKSVFIHGYIQSGGQKMSKTLGNVIDPMELIKTYGTDALRYYLLREISPFDDGDITTERFKEVYNADLANGLGNLVQRVAVLCDGFSFDSSTSLTSLTSPTPPAFQKDIHRLIEQFKFNEALGILWDQLRQLDQFLNREHPWDQEKKKKEEILRRILLGTGGIPSLIHVSLALEPFLPETSEKIKKIFSGPVVTASSPLFPRI